MKKIKLGAFMIAVSFMYGAVTKAATSDAEEIAKMLSTIHGAEVKAEINGDKCRVIYPATEVNEDIMEYSQPTSANDFPQATSKTVTSTIPAAEAECQKVEDFKSYAQYKITSASLHKLMAQYYNKFKFAFVKNLTAGSFMEESQIVPELGLVSFAKLHIGDMAYVKKDETTGLKQEIGNLGTFDMQQQVSDENGQVKYDMNMVMEAFNVALPIFSAHVKSQKQRSEIIYDVSADNVFNYKEILENIRFLTSAKSSAVTDDIKISLFGFNVGFNTELKSNMQRSDEQHFYILGQTKFDNIAFDRNFNNLIGPNAQPKAITLKYSLKDIPAENIIALGELTPKGEISTEDEKAVRDGRVADILDEMAKHAKLVANIEVKFAAASIVGNADFVTKNGYLYGKGTIKVNNLFNIFPEQKQCANNPQADRLPECANPILASLKDVIDTSKNNSETIYKFTEQGVFKNGVKIGDPIELNFRKMSLEMHAKDMEKQARMEDMMKAMWQAGDLQQP